MNRAEQLVQEVKMGAIQILPNGTDYSVIDRMVAMDLAHQVLNLKEELKAVK